MRLQGWEKRFQDYLDYQNMIPFEWGKNDCVLFAARGASAVLGVDLSDVIAHYGDYDETMAETILSSHSGIKGIFDTHFIRKNVKMVNRGDIALVHVGDQQVAGLVIGLKVAVKSITGKIAYVPLSKILVAWETDSWLR